MHWWELGLAHRHDGDEFSPANVVCPYCGTKGRFNRVFRSQALDHEPHGDHFDDVWQCLDCSDHIFVIWRTARGVVDYGIYPRDQRDHAVRKSWPESIARDYRQAISSFYEQNTDACLSLCRRTITAVADYFRLESEDLASAIHDMQSGQHITRPLAEWGIELVAGMDSVGIDSTDIRLAREVLRFSRFLLDEAISIPHIINHYRHPDQN